MNWQVQKSLARCSRGYLRGQTYAEFLMVVLPTLMLMFGIVSFAMTVYTYSFVSNAARDAVRYAIVHGSKSTSPVDSGDLQTFVRHEAQDLNASQINVLACWKPQVGSNTCSGPTGNNAPGDAVSVRVSYSFHPFYPFNSVALPLSSSAQMVISY